MFVQRELRLSFAGSPNKMGQIQRSVTQGHTILLDEKKENILALNKAKYTFITSLERYRKHG